MTAALAADGSRWQSAVRPSLAAPGPVLWGIWRDPTATHGSSGATMRPRGAALTTSSLNMTASGR